jgi:hypothetical protein
LRGCDELRRRVDARYARAGGRDALGQRTVAATEVEDALAGPRREQIEGRRAQIADEARVALVGGGVQR